MWVQENMTITDSDSIEMFQYVHLPNESHFLKCAVEKLKHKNK